jgi:saccharopine dehydrogenase-like NADP-dependent oxidoreductase
MIKVAVVGTNGLAQYIANTLATQTSHQFVILSRRVRECANWEVLTDFV